MNYAGALPADVLLLCGIFGNVSHGDIKRTVKPPPAAGRPRTRAGRWAVPLPPPPERHDDPAVVLLGDQHEPGL